MQPKRFITYNMLPDLGLKTGLNYGTKHCAARFEIIHDSSGKLAVSTIRLVAEGQDINHTPRKALRLAELRAMAPCESNAYIWKELKDFWLCYYRDERIVIPEIRTTTKWSIEEYAASRGLDAEETAILLRHAAHIVAIVDSGVSEEEEDHDEY